MLGRGNCEEQFPNAAMQPSGLPGDLNIGGFQYPVSSDFGGSSRPVKKSNSAKTKIPPPALDVDGPFSNSMFQVALGDSTLIFSPQQLGFMPSNYWLAMDATFGDLVGKFFQRKNNANCRFPHKLYNALALVDHNPALFNLVGVQWVTDRLFKVDKFIFGRLLGIVSIDGALFHQQGNFPSHGFGEVPGTDIERLRLSFDIADVDQDRIRLFYHKGNGFAKSSNEDAVTRCKWITENQPRL
jgi:hypothetical protein